MFGVSAGVLAALLTNPIDVLKTRMMTSQTMAADGGESERGALPILFSLQQQQQQQQQQQPPSASLSRLLVLCFFPAAESLCKIRISRDKQSICMCLKHG